MYVTKVRMVNYMRYVDETVELDPRFNAIVGQTDSGKTTLLRALVWVFYNRPVGMEMIRDGADEARVEIEVNLGTPEDPDLHTIVRLRSKKRNAYIVDGQDFDNVKTDVPDEAKALTGVVTAEIGPKVYVELNVSRQMDGPFMLTGSAGDAAKIMGNLAGITTLDTGLASIKPDLSAVSKELTGAQRLEQTYDETIGEFADLDDQELKLEAIAQQIKSAQQLDARLQDLRRLSERMAEYNSVFTTVDADIAAVSQVLGYRARVAGAAELHARLNALEHLRVDMAGFNQRWNDNVAAVRGAESRVTELVESRKSVLHEAGTCPTCGATT